MPRPGQEVALDAPVAQVDAPGQAAGDGRVVGDDAIVAPSACSSSSRSSTPARWPSRGSRSARRPAMAGRATALAIATRWRSPPDSSVGLCQAVAEPDPLQGLGGPAPPLGRGHAAVQQPGGTLSSALIPSRRKNCWNTKPTALARKAEGAVGQLADLLARDQDGAAGRPVQGAHDVQQGRLAGALGPAMASSSPSSTVRPPRAAPPPRAARVALDHLAQLQRRAASCRHHHPVAGLRPSPSTSTWPSANRPVSTPTSSRRPSRSTSTA